MRRLPALLAVLLVILSACSLPTDEQARVIDPEDLRPELRSDLITTTTTTLQEAPATESIELFLLFPLDDRLVVVPAAREVDTNATLFERLELLFGEEVRSAEEEEAQFSNAVREFNLSSVALGDNNLAIIDVVATDADGNVITVENEVLKNAAAQLVWTATGFDDIERVRLRYNTENILWPTSEGDTDAVLTREDYRRYDENFEPVTDTVPTTTTEAPATTTTAPGG